MQLLAQGSDEAVEPAPVEPGGREQGIEDEPGQRGHYTAGGEQGAGGGRHQPRRGRDGKDRVIPGPYGRTEPEIGDGEMLGDGRGGGRAGREGAGGGLAQRGVPGRQMEQAPGQFRDGATGGAILRQMPFQGGPESG